MSRRIYSASGRDMPMSAPDFLTALYAAVVTVRDRETNEAEVSYEIAEGDRIETLTVTIRRFDTEQVEAAG